MMPQNQKEGKKKTRGDVEDEVVVEEEEETVVVVEGEVVEEDEAGVSEVGTISFLVLFRVSVKI